MISRHENTFGHVKRQVNVSSTKPIDFYKAAYEREDQVKIYGI